MIHRSPQVKLPFQKNDPPSAIQLAQRTLEKGIYFKGIFWPLEQDVSHRSDVRDEKLCQVFHLDFFKQNSQRRGNAFLLSAAKTGQARMLIKLQISCLLAADKSSVCFQATSDYFKPSAITYKGGAAKKGARMNI